MLRTGFLMLALAVASMLLKERVSPRLLGPLDVWFLSCLALSLALVIIAFPALVWKAARRAGVRATSTFALIALVVCTHNVAAWVSAHFHRIDMDAEAWTSWLLCSVVVSLPVIAMLYYFQATGELARSRWGRSAFASGTHAPFAPAERQTTDTLIQRWQGQGLLPEVELGKLLVWKHVFHPTEPPTRYRWMKQRWESGTYLGLRLAPYRIGESYRYEGSMVCAGPYGALLSYVREIGQQGVVLAILAEREAMTALPHHHLTQGVFLAPRGTPVAAYRARRVGVDEFEYQRLEGVDALSWLDQTPALSRSVSRKALALLRKLLFHRRILD